ncbi:MAG TPA: phytoene/squalene synthase family protein [Mycobacteriales bacterium]|nr:phytoene/squalene synthase family protein [Mycobacteriales bacterium]
MGPISPIGSRELDAAGIVDPALRSSYAACRRINAAHGRTFYLSTLLLPAAKRPAVHALYGFARHADDIVDAFNPTASIEQRERELARWSARFLAGDGDGPVLPAVLDTIDRYAIPVRYFEDFLTSMRMDLVQSEYPSWDDLQDYTYGSAAVIGLQMLRVLGTVPGMSAAAAPYARDLGVAFQLTNFIRDVGEDIRRDRVYLPKDELAAFGVTRDDLARGVVSAGFRRLLAFQIARARELLRSAEPGIRLLSPQSRECVLRARILYGGILDAVEAADYRVLDRRVSVGLARRAAVVVPGLVRARRDRRR